MKSSLILLLILVGLCLSACTYQYAAQSLDSFAQAVEIKPHYQIKRLRSIAVAGGDAVCVAPIIFDEIEFQRQFDQQFFTALRARFASVNLLMNIEGQKSALDASRTQFCDLLFFPTIVRRDDKVWSVTEWGEMQTDGSDLGTDRLQLQFSVWDVNSSQLLDAALVESRSAWLDLYASKSQDLIAGSIEEYLQRLVATR
jgi:hypothetical protein